MQNISSSQTKISENSPSPGLHQKPEPSIDELKKTDSTKENDSQAELQQKLHSPDLETESSSTIPETDEPESKNKLWGHPIIQSLNKVFKDDSPLRYALSLDNEIAEALDPTFDQLKAPTWIRNIVYRTLWGMAFMTTGIRSVLEGIKDNNWISGLRKITQDFVSVICATTAIARTANWLQEKLYEQLGINKTETGKFIKNLIRPALTLTACKYTIDYADPIGEKAGDYAVDYAQKLFKAYERKSQPKLAATPA